MMFDEVMRRFMEQAPVCVAVRASLERLLTPTWLEELFAREALHQYQQCLPFSTVAGLLLQVVSGVRSSVHEAYQHCTPMPVSKQSFYAKLNGTEPQLCMALVRESADEVLRVMEHLPPPPPLLPGYALRIVDGNHFSATQRRLKVVRKEGGAPLPGQALVVLDPQRKVVLRALCCEDGHAQERALIPQLLPLVQAGELWIADRMYCTSGMLAGVLQRRGSLLIRQHGRNLRWEASGPWVYDGESATGRVYEQAIRCWDPQQQQWLPLRRVKVELKQPTRDGETELFLLSNLPASVRASVVAELYLSRWQIELAFGELASALECEIRTLGYPRAALLAFCLALVVYNAFSVVKQAIAAVHGQATAAQDLSTYQMGREVAATSHGMEVAVAPQQWQAFRAMSPRAFAGVLQDLAGRMSLQRYQKHPRGAKKPRILPKVDPHKHISTAQLLARQKEQRNSSGP